MTEAVKQVKEEKPVQNIAAMRLANEILSALNFVAGDQITMSQHNVLMGVARTLINEIHGDNEIKYATKKDAQDVLDVINAVRGVVPPVSKEETAEVKA